MRRIPLYLSFALAAPALCQDVKPSPTEELRLSVGRWVETMTAVQQEENDWKRDKEVLQNYKEGLEKEIADLKEQIASAETRKQGTDRASLDKVAERDLYLSAKNELSVTVRKLEENLAKRLTIFPPALASEPKVAQAIEDLKRDLTLPTDQRDSMVSKRLLNLITLASEAEKFQQTVRIRPELHKDKDGREYNMQVIYFGLAMAYAVNEDDSLALAGRPGTDGWTFEEAPALAGDIRKLIASTTGEQDAAFIQLPISKK
ncbi:MAG: DUF3450 family protein [Akkermansiaceae bacterium]